MARGRMLNKTISLSEKFAAMPDDTCRMVATWVIPHLDKRGVFYADPRIVVSQVMPMLNITAETVYACINAMAQAHLIRLFQAAGKTWQVWPGFAENQKGYHLDREGSDFPQPPAEPGMYLECLPDNSGNCRTNSGSLRQKSSEEKGREVEDEGKGSEGCGASAPSAEPITQTATSEFKETPITPETTQRLEAGSPGKSTEVETPRPRDLLFDAIAEVTASDIKLLGSRIGKVTAEFRRINATPDQVRKVAAWYAANDWRGRKGEKLTFEILRQVWQQGLRGAPVNAAAGKTQRREQIQASTDAEREASQEVARRHIAERAARRAAQGAT